MYVCYSTYMNVHTTYTYRYIHTYSIQHTGSIQYTQQTYIHSYIHSYIIHDMKLQHTFIQSFTYMVHTYMKVRINRWRKWWLNFWGTYKSRWIQKIQVSAWGILKNEGSTTGTYVYVVAIYLSSHKFLILGLVMHAIENSCISTVSVYTYMCTYIHVYT